MSSSSKRGSSKLGPNLKIILSAGTFSDVKICVGSTTFPVHKVILAAQSDVFCTMFQAPMAEAEQNCVNISGFSLAVVKGMLQHIYTNSTEIKAEDAGEFLQIADFYNLESLKSDAEKVLKKNLTVDNAVEIFRYSYLYEVPKLRSHVINYIIENKSKFTASPQLEELTKEELIELFLAQ